MGLGMVDGLNDVFDEVIAEGTKDKSILMLGKLRIPYSKPMLYSFAYNMGVKMKYDMLEEDMRVGGWTVVLFSVLWDLKKFCPWISQIMKGQISSLT